MRCPLLLLVVACALGFTRSMPAKEKSSAFSDLEKAWSKVAIEKLGHAPLLERQAKFPIYQQSDLLHPAEENKTTPPCNRNFSNVSAQFGGKG